MGEPKNEIKKVQIADVEKSGDDVQKPELDEAQLEKVSGGGANYGYSGSYNN